MWCVASFVAFARLLPCVLFWSSLPTASADMVSNWTATLDTSASTGKYKVVFEWDHIHTEAVTVDYQANGQKVYNAADDPRCAGSSSAKSAVDDQPFWMPRFFPRAVSSEITQATGIRFVSVDWQPCGHHDIVICHAESHYDMHLYYVDESEVSAMPMCDIGTQSNPGLPVCQDSGSVEANHDYFKLIQDDIPIYMKVSSKGADGTVSKVSHEVNYCVDPTSAIVKSGVHYGDKSETLDEWKAPVTIIGSHKCKLMFFEPMFSWKWVSGNANNGNPTNSWPTYEVSDIAYQNKQYEPLPRSWKLEVSNGCKADNVFSKTTQGPCHIKVTVEGSKCTGACPTPQPKCGVMPNCKCTNGAFYASPVGPLTPASSATASTTSSNSTSTTTTVGCLMPSTTPMASSMIGNTNARVVAGIAVFVGLIHCS